MALVDAQHRILRICYCSIVISFTLINNPHFFEFRRKNHQEEKLFIFTVDTITIGIDISSIIHLKAPCIMSDRSKAQNQRFEVQLAIYDLSQGMARQLSAQFLGLNHAIDIIPHTAILAFEKEYYFGMSGVEASDPHHFRTTRGLSPIKIQHLGHTNITREEFEEWCRQHMQNGTYASHSYDLFHRNCNHFSHHASQHLGVLGVPEDILGVPQKVLSSPMGTLLGPILQQMQITPSGEGNSLGTTAKRASEEEKKEMTSIDNPWAHLNQTSNAESKSQVKTPLLDSYSKPFLANDASMVKLCIEKIQNGQGIQTLNDKDRSKMLESLMALSKLFSGQDMDRKAEDLYDDIHLLRMVLDCDQASATEKTFVLMLLRLIVLQKCIDTSIRVDIMTSMRAIITKKELKSTLRAMAWCVITNCMGANDAWYQHISEKTLESLVDLAIAGLSKDSTVDVRRGTAAFLFNLLLSLKKVEGSSHDLSELQVTILCAVGELIADETDVEVVTRLLLVIGKITKTHNQSNKAAELLSDLGSIETVQTISQGTAAITETGKVKELVNEIVHLANK
jgi:hypothetical protein